MRLSLKHSCMHSVLTLGCSFSMAPLWALPVEWCIVVRDACLLWVVPYSGAEDGRGPEVVNFLVCVWGEELVECEEDLRAWVAHLIPRRTIYYITLASMCSRLPHLGCSPEMSFWISCLCVKCALCLKIKLFIFHSHLVFWFAHLC